MIFGDRVRTLREARGWTQAELGERLNLSQSTINRYENDARSPDIETLCKVADVFGVSVDFLIGRSDSLTVPHIENQPVFARRLRRLRESQGLSASEAASELGVPETVLAKYETGDLEPDIDFLRKTAIYFDVSTDYLLGLAEHEALAAHRSDDPTADLPDEARRSLEEFIKYVTSKYSKR